VSTTAIDQNDTPCAPRRAILDDMAVVASIHRLAFFDAMPHIPALHTPEETLTYFSNILFQKAQIWLGERDGLIAGFIAFRPGWVEQLYIHPQHQGRGIGSMLLELVKNSEPELRLWTFQCNKRACRFYERHGFRIEQQTDGAANEERQPDYLYVWSRVSP
jgi:ribosomal protein S18 acetylase RimI-like enzyme